MSNVIRVYVENPDDILNVGHSGAGAVVQLQRDTVEAFSTPVDVATAAIVSGTRAYTIYDAVGGSTTWYRTRYETSGGTGTSDWSTPFLVGANAYCSLDDVKQDLEKTGPTDTQSDELLSDYIAEATDYIRGYTSRDFATTSGVFLFDGLSASHGGRALRIPRGVQSISLLEAAAITGGSFSTIPSSAYVLRPTVQERTPGWPATEVWITDYLAGSPYSSFPYGYGTVRLTGVLGFGVPARVEGVARRLVVRAYASRQAGQGDLIGSGGEGGTPTVSQFLSKRDREILDQFSPALVA